MIDDDYEPANDYEDQMDAIRLGLQSEQDSYCKHGTFVGNWAGPDYMCGFCEMGVSDEEFIEGQRIALEDEAKRSAAHAQWKVFLEKVEASPSQVDKDDLWVEVTEWLASEEGKWLFR